MFLDLLAKFSKLPVIPITKLYFNSLKHKIGANLKLFIGYTLVAFISLAVEKILLKISVEMAFNGGNTMSG